MGAAFRDCLAGVPGLRDWLATRQVPYVLATLAGIDAAGRVDPAAWERRSLGYGAHGERVYDWTAVALDPVGLPEGWAHWLLVRQQVELTE